MLLQAIGNMMGRDRNLGQADLVGDTGHPLGGFQHLGKITACHFGLHDVQPHGDTFQHAAYDLLRILRVFLRKKLVQRGRVKMQLIRAAQDNDIMIGFCHKGLKRCNICHGDDLGHQSSQKVESLQKNLSKSMKMQRIYGGISSGTTHMKHARALPNYLVTRYKGWKATTYAENKGWYRHLAQDGQHPRAMVISCCDSRVHVTALFGADQGEFFIHRNIANLVPPHNPDGHHHGTSAAVEYAVQSLKVSHLIVLGHSGCGGVEGCYNMCSGHAPELEASTSFVGRWMDILRPGFESLPDGDEPTRKRALEKASVLISLENLMTFPFVKSAVEDDMLTLHGLWNDIGEGGLEVYDRDADAFVVV